MSLTSKTLCFAALAFAASLSFEAAATPPRVTFLEQELIGANANYAYTRLRLSDNAGTYYVKRVDDYVIKLELQTSLAVSHLPLRSTITDTVDGYPGELQELPVEDAVAVDAYLIAEKASPSLRRGFEPLGYKIKNGSLITNFDDPSGASGAITLKSNAELLDILSSQINSIFARYGELTEEQSQSLSGENLLTTPIEDVSGCQVIEQYTPIWESDYEAETRTSLIPLRIKCDYYEETQIVSFFVFVPDWQQFAP